MPFASGGAESLAVTLSDRMARQSDVFAPLPGQRHTALRASRHRPNDADSSLTDTPAATADDDGVQYRADREQQPKKRSPSLSPRLTQARGILKNNGVSLIPSLTPAAVAEHLLGKCGSLLGSSSSVQFRGPSSRCPGGRGWPALRGQWLTAGTATEKHVQWGGCEAPPPLLNKPRG